MEGGELGAVSTLPRRKAGAPGAAGSCLCSQVSPGLWGESPELGAAAGTCSKAAGHGVRARPLFCCIPPSWNHTKSSPHPSCPILPSQHHIPPSPDNPKALQGAANTVPRPGERQAPCSTKAREASASPGTILRSRGAPRKAGRLLAAHPGEGNSKHSSAPSTTPGTKRAAADSPAGRGTWHGTARGVAQEGMLMVGQRVPPSVDGQELPQALLGGGQQRKKPRGHLLAPPGERLRHEHRSHRLPPQHYEGGGRLRGTPSGAGMGRGVARGGQAAAVSAATRSPRDGQRGSEGSDGCTWPGPPPARPHGHPSGTRVPISPSAWDGPALSHRGVTAGPGSCHRRRGC